MVGRLEKGGNLGSPMWRTCGGMVMETGRWRNKGERAGKRRLEDVRKKRNLHKERGGCMQGRRRYNSREGKRRSEEVKAECHRNTYAREKTTQWK